MDIQSTDTDYSYVANWEKYLQDRDSDPRSVYNTDALPLCHLGDWVWNSIFEYKLLLMNAMRSPQQYQTTYKHVYSFYVHQLQMK